MKDRDRQDEAPEAPEAPPAPEAQSDGAGAGGEPAPSGTDSPSPERDRYLRLAAEYDNYRKRTNKERFDFGAKAQAELVSKMIDALDDLSRFAHIDPATTDPQTLHKGIELVDQKLMKVLTAAGLEIIDPVDQTFDPQLHEAVTTEPALSPEDDHTVARVFQRGYRFNGQLLRPARVVVKQWAE
jgi:molecular chaperone GrpE